MEVEKMNLAVLRDYRKGNWTVEETLILIEAKKLDEQRRSTPKPTTTKPTELRWKWIEEHCWKKGCFRSQNQCNDKWDNLMRDFKKVREFETRRLRSSSLIKSDNNINNGDNDDDGSRSYWNMEKLERKNHNLPSNMLSQIYDALAHVVEGKMGISVLSNPTTTTMGLYQHPCTATGPPLLLPPSRLPCAGGGIGGDQQPLPNEGKRRKPNEEGSNLIETIKWYEEREETRHKELYIMHQKRYKIEESRIEMERQGFNELVDAINSLSNSILAFTTSQRTPS